jgi:hypothetical protein
MEEVMNGILSLMLMLVFFMPSLACRAMATRRVEGSGRILNQEIDVRDFNSVVLEGFGDVYLEQGQTESLSIQTDDNLISVLDIKVIGKELRIGTKPGINVGPSESIIYNLIVKDLKRVSLAGSGNIYAEPLKTNDLNISLTGSGNIQLKSVNASDLSIDLSGSGNITLVDVNAIRLETSLKGSGDIKLAGKVESQRLTFGGSGNYRAGDLETNRTDISIPGSADVTVWVNQELIVRISGSGDIQYYGKPIVDQNVSGPGHITSLGNK